MVPEVGEALARVPGGPHVIDAEACVLDSIGRMISSGCTSAPLAGTGTRAARR